MRGHEMISLESGVLNEACRSICRGTDLCDLSARRGATNKAVTLVVNGVRQIGAVTIIVTCLGHTDPGAGLLGVFNTKGLRLVEDIGASPLAGERAKTGGMTKALGAPRPKITVSLASAHITYERPATPIETATQILMISTNLFEIAQV